MWFTIFSDVSFFFLGGGGGNKEIYKLPGFCIIIAPFCPTFVVGNVVRLFLPTSSNTAYTLSRTGIVAGFYCVPMKMDTSSVCPRQGSRFYQSINQLYLNTVNGSASWFSDMPCDNYNL